MMKTYWLPLQFKSSIEKQSKTLCEIHFYTMNANFDQNQNRKFFTNNFLHTLLPHCWWNVGEGDESEPLRLIRERNEPKRWKENTRKREEVLLDIVFWQLISDRSYCVEPVWEAGEGRRCSWLYEELVCKDIHLINLTVTLLQYFPTAVPLSSNRHTHRWRAVVFSRG